MTNPETHPVTLGRAGQIGIIRIDNPPVNALSLAVRRGLIETIAAAQAEPEIAAIVLIGENGLFSAGADLAEFHAGHQPPFLDEICALAEDGQTPAIAAISGTTYGGGFEIALGCHYRIAAPGTRVALPEVLLGILPGGSGSQRLPRIVGAKAALDFMLSGAPVKTDAALAMGVIDRVSGPDLLADALAFAEEIVAAGASLPRSGQRLDGLGDLAVFQAEVDAARARLTASRSPLFAPYRIVDCVEAAGKLPLAEGLALEREKIVECIASDQHRALVHAFLAERQSARFPEADAARPPPLETIAVIGGGTMGAGIAVAALDGGLKVLMVERDDASAARGKANVAKVYDRLVSRGRMSAAERAQRLARFSAQTGYDGLGAVDLAIEAVFEDMAVKKAVFTDLDKALRPGAILASNTSFLDVGEIAAVTSRPADVLGLHFFSPANIMKLLEIVVPETTGAEAVVTGLALARALRKVPVRAGVCDGFIGNRMIGRYADVAAMLIEDGASPYQVDAAMLAFGYPMGPFQMSDLAGNDIAWAVRKRQAATRDPALRYVEIADRICENGWFGQKSGRGYYLYPDGARVGTPDPEVAALIEAERANKGIAPRSFSDEEIVDRLLAVMINEGAFLLEEGIASRPSDVDVTKIYGYGFPRWRGGPMHYADTIGLGRVLAKVQAMAAEDPAFWRPAPLLQRLVAEGRDFASLNGA